MPADTGARLLKLGFRTPEDFIVINDAITEWHSKTPCPSDAEIMAVDLSQPNSQESARKRAIEILKADVPDTWKDSTNAQQRVAWAMKQLFRGMRQELKG